MSSPLTRRGLLGLGGALGAAALLSACSSSNDTLPVATPSSTTGKTVFTQEQYDALVTSGPVAPAEMVSQNAWAQAIKAHGALRRAGTDTSPIFSLRNPSTNRLKGFDAGIADLLAHYILGGSDVAKLTEFSKTTVDTRETMIQNKTVDVTIATYSITPARAEKVAFAGPYFVSGTAVQVKRSNNDIKSYADLNVDGKKVTTETNSTAIAAIQKFIPKAEVTLFTENDACVAAVRQGRVDAYILDQSILLSNAVNYDDLKVVGEPFTTDPYGIGLTKDDPGAKTFVNDFLTKIFTDGTWKKLYDGTVGPYVAGEAPTPPALGGVPGA
ncbi:glutamate transport system substrate-binding protein [Propionibacterium cyclohexanicum]|uniref:Glutamate transport system substrate-binding protein n=1 Tax=Propionibacterium cyclohexanicum TaxID=64702 RepID=A0A1H9Q7Q1_9ACTN|nr:glutamate ABC transporter substrate-binding protein [Propionibacterium cyclohexanicum]SER56460.1 glutamate transport system substrate-binding protein [Propionibacterium cyclohexanicum]